MAAHQNPNVLALKQAYARWRESAGGSADEVLALFDDQVEFAGLAALVDDPELGPLRQVGPPIRFSGVEPVVAPMPALLIAVAIWKVLTEALFPMSGAPIWEFVERAGSYTAPIALVLLLGSRPFTRINLTRSIAA